jgi:hypothetical protein
VAFIREDARCRGKKKRGGGWTTRRPEEGLDVATHAARQGGLGGRDAEQWRASVAAVGADRQDRRGGGRRLARGPGSASNDGLPWAGPERTVPHFYFD